MTPEERLKGLVYSEHWKPLETYLNERKSTLIMKLLTCSPEDLSGLQSRAQELDTLLDLKITLQARSKPQR